MEVNVPYFDPPLVPLPLHMNSAKLHQSVLNLAQQMAAHHKEKEVLPIRMLEAYRLLLDNVSRSSLIIPSGLRHDSAYKPLEPG
jgi:hypothetical protein